MNQIFDLLILTLKNMNELVYRKLKNNRIIFVASIEARMIHSDVNSNYYEIYRQMLNFEKLI